MSFSNESSSTKDDRNEQLSAEFRPLVCRQCGTEVQVRKRSPEQTSVQWFSDPANCPHLVRPAPTAAPVDGCPALADTIRAAVQAGLIPSGSWLTSGSPPPSGSQ